MGMQNLENFVCYISLFFAVPYCDPKASLFEPSLAWLERLRLVYEENSDETNGYLPIKSYL